MADLPVLNLTPAQAGYTVTPGQQGLQAALAGGPSRFRLDMLNAAGTVAVQWECTPLQFQYLESFMRTTARRTLPFLIDLVIDGFDLATYTATMVPGTESLPQLQGNLTIKQATLEVEMASDEGADTDAALQMLYGIYGDDAPRILNLLASLANVHLPNIQA